MTAAVTLCLAKMAGCSDRYGHPMACLKAACLYSIIHQVLANNFGICVSLLLSALDTYVPKPGSLGKPPIDGATGDTPRVHPGLSLGETHLGNAYCLDCGLPHANLGTHIPEEACQFNVQTCENL